MTKKIITISREFGSGGRSIGKTVAEKLNIPYYDKELIKQVAEETGLSLQYIENAGEYAPGKSFLSFLPSLSRQPGSMESMSAADFLWCMQRKVILDLAEKGSCVIVGRCADYILKDNPDTFHVFLHHSRRNALSDCMAKVRGSRRSALQTKIGGEVFIISTLPAESGVNVKTIIYHWTAKK